LVPNVLSYQGNPKSTTKSVRRLFQTRDERTKFNIYVFIQTDFFRGSLWQHIIKVRQQKVIISTVGKYIRKKTK